MLKDIAVALGILVALVLIGGLAAIFVIATAEAAMLDDSSED